MSPVLQNEGQALVEEPPIDPISRVRNHRPDQLHMAVADMSFQQILQRTQIQHKAVPSLYTNTLSPTASGPSEDSTHFEPDAHPTRRIDSVGSARSGKEKKYVLYLGQIGGIYVSR